MDLVSYTAVLQARHPFISPRIRRVFCTKTVSGMLIDLAKYAADRRYYCGPGSIHGRLTSQIFSCAADSPRILHKDSF